jgi:hypothetical protein
MTCCKDPGACLLVNQLSVNLQLAKPQIFTVSYNLSESYLQFTCELRWVWQFPGLHLRLVMCCQLSRGLNVNPFSRDAPPYATLLCGP